MKSICLGYLEPDKFETITESKRNVIFEPRVGSSLCVADFLSKRDRRVTEPEKNANQLDIEFETARPTTGRVYAMERFDPVELFLYSLTSAAAFSVLLIGFLKIV
jgi:hypothetical protein